MAWVALSLGSSMVAVQEWWVQACKCKAADVDVHLRTGLCHDPTPLTGRKGSKTFEPKPTALTALPHVGICGTMTLCSHKSRRHHATSQGTGAHERKPTQRVLDSCLLLSQPIKSGVHCKRGCQAKAARPAAPLFCPPLYS